MDSLGAYFLRGVTDDNILVFRTPDDETLLRIIQRLAASRDKEIRGVAKKLELEWFRRQQEQGKNGTTGLSSKARPKDSSKNQDGSGN
jgi:hypothetical protein